MGTVTKIWKRQNGIVNPITIESKKRFAINADQSDIFRQKNYVHPWPKGTTLITGSSILLGIQEGKLKKYKAKVRAFSGATVDDMQTTSNHYLGKSRTTLYYTLGLTIRLINLQMT